jgi:hypothetical protein
MYSREYLVLTNFQPKIDQVLACGRALDIFKGKAWYTRLQLGDEAVCGIRNQSYLVCPAELFSCCRHRTSRKQDKATTKYLVEGSR